MAKKQQKPAPAALSKKAVTKVSAPVVVEERPSRSRKTDKGKKAAVVEQGSSDNLKGIRATFSALAEPEPMVFGFAIPSFNETKSISPEKPSKS